MIDPRLGAALFLAGLCVLPLTVLGHHSAVVTYHTDQIVEAEGEITNIIWKNPHVRFTINVTDADGRTAPWNIESIPASRLVRVGVSEDVVRVGQTVRVAGYPSRRSTTDMYALNLLLPDGREMLLDTPVARWSNDTVGTGEDLTPGAISSDTSLGLFRVWSTDGRPLSLGSILTNPNVQLTEKALADAASWDPLSLDNPFLGCSPKGMPNIMEQPNPIEFVDRGDEILLRMEEYDTVRVISMRPASDDEPFQRSILGRSVGHWNGSVLVVETDRIDWSHFNQRGLRQSAAMNVVERFSPNEDGARLDYELTMTDATLFAEPAVLTKSWVWVPGDEILLYDCTE